MEDDDPAPPIAAYLEGEQCALPVPTTDINNHSNMADEYPAPPIAAYLEGEQCALPIPTTDINKQ